MSNNRRRRKQKRLISIITIVVALVLIAGVGAYYFLTKDGQDAQETSSVETSENQAKQESSKDEEKTTEDVPNTYENLIAGTGKLSFSYYKDNILADVEYPDYQDELFGYLKSNEYTLPDLIDEFNTIFNTEDRYFGDEGVTYVGYSYLDCGNDGNKELALQMVCPVVEESSSLTMILKEMDGQIQVVYAFCEWSRSDTNINEFGVISGGGSGGATLHGWDESVLDANGKYVFGYSEEEQADVNMFYTGEAHDEIDTSSLDGVICVYSLYTKKPTAEDAWPQYYSYAVYKDYEEEMDIPNLYTDSEYQRIMDTFGVDFIPMDQFNKIVEDRLKEIGVTEEMRNGKNLEYIEIKF